MKIAVTGASGHIGSNLCPLLKIHNHSVKALVYKGKSNLNDLDIELIHGNILDKNSLLELVEDTEVVVHLAAKISITKDKDGSVYNINTKGTKNLVEACIEKKVKRLIYFSSIHTFNPFPLDQPLDESRPLIGAKGSDYDKSKIEGEQIALNAIKQGLEVIVICPTSVLGPNDYQPSLLGGAIMDIYNNKIPALVPGGYDFVDVRDIAKGTLRAIEKGKSGEKYLLSGKYLTIKELSSIIGNLSNKATPKKVLPIQLLKILLPVFQLQSHILGKPPIFTKESLLALTTGNPYISSAKAEKELDYRKTPIEKSIFDTLQWFKTTA